MRFLTAILFVFVALHAQAQSFDELNSEFVSLFQKEDYQKAVPIGEKAIAQARKEFGEKHLNYAIANHNLAEAYQALKQADNALLYFKEAIQLYALFQQTHGSELALCHNSAGIIFFIRKQYDSAAFHYEKSFSFFIKNPQEQYNNLVVLLNNLSDVYLTTANHKKAQLLYEKLLPVIKTKEGTDNSNYYTTLANLASVYLFQQLLQDAEKTYKLTIEILKRLKGTENTEYTYLLDQLASVILEQSRLNEAEKIALESFNLKKAIQGVDTFSLVSSYNILGNIYTQLSDYTSALNFFEQALRLLKEANAVENEWYETTLRNFGQYYMQSGSALEAKNLLSELLEIQKRKYGDNYPENGVILYMIANTEFVLNQLALSEQHALESITLISAGYGKENYAVGKAMEVLGMVYHKLGKSEQGIKLYQDAINIAKKVFGPESDHLAYTLSDLGIIYQDLANYAQAEIVFKESLRIRKKIYGSKHPLFALSLANLSLVHLMQGRYEEAAPALTEALTIYKEKGLGNTNNFLLILNNIGFMANQIGMYEEANKIYAPLVGLLQSDENKNYATLFVLLVNLGQNHLYQKKYDEAIKYSQEAVAIAKKYYGVNTQNYITALNNNFSAYLENGNLKTAAGLLAELIPLCKQVMGEDAPLLGTLYFNASVLETRMNDFTKASEYIESFTRITLNAFSQNFYTLSEKEKLTWWQEQSFRFNLFPSLLLLNPSSPEKLKDNFTNQQLQLKGFVLSDAASALRRARQSGNINLRKLIDEWQMNRGLISKQSSLPLEQRFFSIDSLEKIANDLEKQINQVSSGLIRQKDEVIDWKKIQNNLFENEAAIEFVRFKIFNKNWTDTFRYAALVIRKNNTPQFVPLCTEVQISYCLNKVKDNDKQVNINGLYRSTITSSKNNSKFLGDSLYKLIWEPLLPYLQNVNIVSYAPDGLLHKVAFHALPTPDKKNLIDNYQLQQYTSIRQLVSRKEDSEPLISVFLLGNANFNTPPGAKTLSGTRTLKPAWSSLPGTEKEIIALQQLFKLKKIKTTTVSSGAATEEAIKSLDGKSTSIMHVATHGFFLPEPGEDTLAKTHSKNVFALANDPLLRSGIVVTGANSAWNGIPPPEGREDGIITAFEIAQMDLSNTKLVVLSACETALGDLQGSEGVFGLQRAFKIAGVKNMVVSLWQVPDKETVELMTAFYSNLLSGKEIREAFYLAQKELCSRYTPFYWAAFVLVE